MVLYQLVIVVALSVMPYQFYSRTVITKVSHDYAELVSFDKKYMDVTVFKFYKKNRITKALNMTYEMLYDYNTDKEARLKVSALQWKNNEYKKTVVDFNLGLCSLMKNMYLNMSMIVPHSNITKCPIPKAVYYVNDISPPVDFLPPHFPEGKWMFDITLNRYDKKVVHFHWMSSITRVISNQNN